jgi:hypothetical protein
LERKRISEGKRIAEERMNCKGENELKGGLLKGKEFAEELLKENC